MCLQNLKFVALPVPEIIGGTPKNVVSPWICPRSLFSKLFNGLLFGWTLWMYWANLKFVALSVPEIIAIHPAIYFVQWKYWHFGPGLRTSNLEKGGVGGREWCRLKERWWLPNSLTGVIYKAKNSLFHHYKKCLTHEHISIFYQARIFPSKDCNTLFIKIGRYLERL